MKIKVCGLRDRANLQAIAQLPIDMVGLIFHADSPRYVDEAAGEALGDLSELVGDKAMVGVFVNAEVSEILQQTSTYRLDYAQLHGNESADYCASLKQVWPSLKVIKAFSVDADFDFDQTSAYERHVDYFLFDTKGKNRGGNGEKFDWSILKKYQGFRQFFVSGGIGPDDADQVKQLNFPQLAGIDVNSGFETAPAEKDVVALAEFVAAVKGE